MDVTEILQTLGNLGFGAVLAYFGKMWVDRWREALGRRKRQDVQLQTAIESAYTARSVAKQLGATDEQLGPLPE